MSAHHTLDLLENYEGWWPAECICGTHLGAFPSAEDAADALMDHAYQAGRAEALAASGEQHGA